MTKSNWNLNSCNSTGVSHQDVDAVEIQHVPHGEDSVLGTGDQNLQIEIDSRNHVLVGLHEFVGDKFGPEDVKDSNDPV